MSFDQPQQATMSLLLVTLLLSSITQQSVGVPNFSHQIIDSSQLTRRDNDYAYADQIERTDDNNVQNDNTFANNVDYEGKELRRFFDWFTKRKVTPKVIVTTEGTTDSSYEKELKDRIFLKAIHRNMTEVLSILTEIEKHVAATMDEKESNAALIRGKPRVLNIDNGYLYPKRIKRGVSDAVEGVKVSSDSDNDTAKVNITDGGCANATSGRRYLKHEPNDRIKTKLVSYLNENFNELKTKINLTKKLKEHFGNDAGFNVGYILAHVDTLGLSMLNLKSDLKTKLEQWDDSTLLELYDTLKTSNKAVSTLVKKVKYFINQLKPQLVAE